PGGTWRLPKRKLMEPLSSTASALGPAYSSSNISAPPLEASHSSTTTSCVVCGGREVESEKGIRREVLSCASTAKSGRTVKSSAQHLIFLPLITVAPLSRVTTS